MSRFRKLLFLAPLGVAFWLSDKTLVSYGHMLVGGIVFWVPYWLAWWLSDGFDVVLVGGPVPGQMGRHGSGSTNTHAGTVYKAGPQGVGVYAGSVRMS